MSTIIRLLIVVLLVIPSPSFAAITFTDGYWTTSFVGASEITATTTPIADDLAWGDSYVCALDDPDKNSAITPSANNSTGAGGLGYRKYQSYNINDGSTALRVEFPSAEQEIWIRYYIRWQEGFSYQDYSGLYTKNIYAYADGTAAVDVNIPSYDANDITVDFRFAASDDEVQMVNAGGFQTFYPSGTSDGSWHRVDIHLMLSDAGTANGGARVWIDGDLQFENTSTQWNTPGTGFTYVDMISNSRGVYPQSACMYIDVDDIAVATSAYTGFIQDEDNNYLIGPITSAGSTSIGGGAGSTSIGGGTGSTTFQ